MSIIAAADMQTKLYLCTAVFYVIKIQLIVHTCNGRGSKRQVTAESWSNTHWRYVHSNAAVYGETGLKKIDLV